MHVRVGHSPDPDDAFMVWAIAERALDLRGFEIELVPADIQTLNGWAAEGRLEATAMSVGAYPGVQDTYRLLGQHSEHRVDLKALGRPSAATLRGLRQHLKTQLGHYRTDPAAIGHAGSFDHHACRLTGGNQVEPVLATQLGQQS